MCCFFFPLKKIWISLISLLMSSRWSSKPTPFCTHLINTKIVFFYCIKLAVTSLNLAKQYLLKKIVQLQEKYCYLDFTYFFLICWNDNKTIYCVLNLFEMLLFTSHFLQTHHFISWVLDFFKSIGEENPDEEDKKTDKNKAHKRTNQNFPWLQGIGILKSSDG